jgi:DNA polymerase III psi subunit
MNNESKEKLPYHILAQLYKNVLIEDTKAHQQTSSEEKIVAKDVLIVVKSTSKSLAEKQIFFLTAILKALKLSLTDIHLITDKDENFGSYKKITAKYAPKKIILFGISPSDIALPMHFPNFQVQGFENKKYLCSPNLEEIEDNKSIKLTLWQSLQQLFS